MLNAVGDLVKETAFLLIGGQVLWQLYLCSIDVLSSGELPLEHRFNGRISVRSHYVIIDILLWLWRLHRVLWRYDSTFESRLTQNVLPVYYFGWHLLKTFTVVWVHLCMVLPILSKLAFEFKAVESVQWWDRWYILPLYLSMRRNSSWIHVDRLLTDNIELFLLLWMSLVFIGLIGQEFG